MSEEEKKQLEIFKKEVEKEQSEYEKVNEYTKFFYNNRKFVLNLIQKQQEEIKNLKIDIQEAWNEWNDLEQGSYEEENKLKAELEKKDKIIDLILQDMIDQKCYSTSRTILKRIYEKKVEEE